jgi:translation elongation factor EF-Tu-like GTPase
MSGFAFTDRIDKERTPPFRVRAVASMLRSEDGGRQTGIRSGYRPNHNFGPTDGRTFYIGQIDFAVPVTIEPGQSAEVVVTFVTGPGLWEDLQPGRQWRIQEGPKLVAVGEVQEVLSEI